MRLSGLYNTDMNTGKSHEEDSSHVGKVQRAGAGARPVRVELVENPFRVVRSNGIRGRSGFRRAEAFAGNTGSGYLVGSNVSFRRYRSAYFPADLICSGRML